MITRTKRNVFHLSILLLGTLVVLPLMLPANETESTVVHSNIPLNKKVIDFFDHGAAQAEITFSELMHELGSSQTCFKNLQENAQKNSCEVQTIDLIATIIDNCNELPLELQSAIQRLQTKSGEEKLRAQLEILLNEAKALELLENQLSDNPGRRLPWRVLCERVAFLLRENHAYGDFVKALVTAKESYCVLFAKMRLKGHLSKLPRRIANVAKDVDKRCPGDVGNRIFFEG